MAIKRSVLAGLTIAIALSAASNAGAQAPNLVDSRANYWAQKPSTVIAKSAITIPAAWRVDGQALVDAELNPRVAGSFSSHLASVDIETPLNEGVIRMGQILRSGGIEVRTSRAPIDLSTLRPFDNAREGITTLLDMRPLRATFQRDYLMLMGVTKAGVVREYGADGKASGTPAGYGVAVAELIDLRNNTIVWRYRATERAKSPGQWYQSADYPVATASVQLAVRNAIEMVLRQF